MAGIDYCCYSTNEEFDGYCRVIEAAYQISKHAERDKMLRSLYEQNLFVNLKLALTTTGAQKSYLAKINASTGKNVQTMFRFLLNRRRYIHANEIEFCRAHDELFRYFCAYYANSWNSVRIILEKNSYAGDLMIDEIFKMAEYQKEKSPPHAIFLLSDETGKPIRAIHQAKLLSAGGTYYLNELLLMMDYKIHKGTFCFGIIPRPIAARIKQKLQIYHTGKALRTIQKCC